MYSWLEVQGEVGQTVKGLGQTVYALGQTVYALV
jgi:hypothetical protein